MASKPDSPSWQKLEINYRALSKKYFEQSQEYLAKVTEMPRSTPAEIRLLIAMSRLASRMATQAKHYEKFANDAKKRDEKEWVELCK